LFEADRDKRMRERRSRAGGDEGDERAYFQSLHRAGQARDFFADDLEAFHKAYEDRQEAINRVNANMGPGQRQAREDAHADRIKANDRVIHHGARLARVAHKMEHPVGRYLDPKRLTNHRTLLRAIQRVSIRPGTSNEHTTRYGPYHRIWYDGPEQAQHIEHGLAAHGLDPRHIKDGAAFEVGAPKENAS
jgi:hypothetical protein